MARLNDIAGIVSAIALSFMMLNLFTPFLLALRASGWFDERSRIMPRPSSEAGCTALIVSVTVLVGDVYSIPIVIGLESFPAGVQAISFLVMQFVLFFGVVIAWRHLFKAEALWQRHLTIASIPTRRSRARG
jgi:hypothetical protein